jgi:hypothetical protein
MIKGPDGKLHKIGENFNYTTQDPTGAVTGGFDDAFYNNYGDTYSRYYKGDVQTQYDDATTKQMFALARAGTSASSAANAANVDLIAQKTKNDASIDVKADAAKSALKDKVEAEKQKSIAQLYATEDPDVASNTALAAVRNLSEATPDQTPLAAVFNQATIGAANLLKGYNSGKTYNQFESSLPSGMGSGRNV